MWCLTQFSNQDDIPVDERDIMIEGVNDAEKYKYLMISADRCHPLMGPGCDLMASMAWLMKGEITVYYSDDTINMEDFHMPGYEIAKEKSYQFSSLYQTIINFQFSNVDVVTDEGYIFKYITNKTYLILDNVFSDSNLVVAKYQGQFPV